MHAIKADARLLIEDRGIHRRLVINRPQKANALDREALEAFGRALENTVRHEDIRLLEITGAGERAFCAGADLAETSGETGDAKLAQAFDARWDEVTSAIADLPCITVANVNGACIGGGLSIALACDFRIGSESAFFAYPAARHGFMPSPADVHRLVTLIGPTQAKSILLLGRRKSAAEAAHIGLADLLPRGMPVEQALAEMIKSIESGQVNSLLAMKRLADMNPPVVSMVQDCYRSVYEADRQAIGRLRNFKGS